MYEIRRRLQMSDDDDDTSTTIIFINSGDLADLFSNEELDPNAELKRALEQATKRYVDGKEVDGED